MAIGESRREEKQAIREKMGKAWSVSTGKIHAFKTRSVYQEHALKFVAWARDTYQIKRLEDLDARADELATEWLNLHLKEGKSPSTLKTERAALRMFFGSRTLAGSVKIPRRSREKITRSRLAVAHDRYFNPANWPELVGFLRAVGVRRSELKLLHCRHVRQDHEQAYVHVDNGKGGRSRDVPVLPGQEQHVLSLIAGRDPDELLFPRIPKHLDVHSYRREYAKALYLYHAPGRELPPTKGRLRPQDYDRAAARKVSDALGHNRIDVVTRHYIR